MEFDTLLNGRRHRSPKIHISHNAQQPQRCGHAGNQESEFRIQVTDAVPADLQPARCRLAFINSTRETSPPLAQLTNCTVHALNAAMLMPRNKCVPDFVRPLMRLKKIVNYQKGSDERAPRGIRVRRACVA